MKISLPQQQPSLGQWLVLLLPPITMSLALYLVGLKPESIKFFGLYLPGVWLLWQSIRRPQKGWLIAAHIWAFAFSLDILIRISLWASYRSLPDSNFVLFAISNTNRQEIIEYFVQNSYLILGLPILFGTNLWIYLFRQKISATVRARTIVSSIIIIFLGLIFLVAYSLRPTRNLTPFIYWPKYLNTVQKFQKEMQNGPIVNKRWDEVAQNIYQQYTGPEQQTLVLAIGESTTRLNLQLCGYLRDTTPELTLIREQLALFCNGYSGASSTVESLKLMLTDETLSKPDSWDKGTSLLAVARKAGFHIIWLSNQDDLFTATMFGGYADKSIFLNRRSGRTSVSLDETLLADYTLALADRHARKLIVVHLIGNHPNYAARYPVDREIFTSDTDDVVNNNMIASDRNLWIRNQRAHYDNAVLYQDFILKQLISGLRQANLPNKHFVFASDHGNEVGHVRDFAGHSPTTEAGYAIPLIYWGDAQAQLAGYESRQFVTDNLDQTLLQLLQIHTTQYDQSLDIFSDKYIWKKPQHWPLWEEDNHF